MIIEFVINVAPRGKMDTKSVHVKTKSGKSFTSAYKCKRQRSYEEELEAEMEEHAPEIPLSGPIRLDCKCFLKTPTRYFGRYVNKKMREDMAANRIRCTTKPDRDNLEKNLCDALTREGFWYDDAQVVCGEVTKQYDDGGGPRWEVRIEEL